MFSMSSQQCGKKIEETKHAAAPRTQSALYTSLLIKWEIWGKQNCKTCKNSQLLPGEITGWNARHSLNLLVLKIRPNDIGVACLLLFGSRGWLLHGRFAVFFTHSVSFHYTFR